MGDVGHIFGETIRRSSCRFDLGECPKNYAAFAIVISAWMPFLLMCSSGLLTAKEKICFANNTFNPL